MGYRNAFYDSKNKNIHLLTWNEEGERVEHVEEFNPYFFIESENGTEKSIFGTKLIKKTFNTAYDRYQYLKRTDISRIFDNFPPVQQFLIDKFWDVNESKDFSKHKLKVLNIDIETYSEGHFPDIENPSDTVNVITAYDSLEDGYITWGLGKFKNNEKDNVTYIECGDEKELLKSFISHIEKDHPDIITGWNIIGFDIPYIVNRIDRILGEDWVKKLSPSHKVYSRTMLADFGKQMERWYFEGVSIVDYLDIYKKFTQGERESYKLDAIAETELGENKIDYGNQNLSSLADSDWQTFVEYNIHDVRLVKRLEDKLKYIELVRMLAYIGLTTFEPALGSLSIINGATAIKARFENKRIPTFKRDQASGKNPGAYVAEPLPGFQEHIVSFDANSLYPNVMISLNMSPETKVGKITNMTDKEVSIKHTTGKIYNISKEKFKQFIKKDNIAISRANTLFTQTEKGIIPQVLDFYYNKRVEIKKELTDYKKQLAQIEEKLSQL